MYVCAVFVVDPQMFVSSDLSTLAIAVVQVLSLIMSDIAVYLQSYIPSHFPFYRGLSLEEGELADKYISRRYMHLHIQSTVYRCMVYIPSRDTVIVQSG